MTQNLRYYCRLRIEALTDNANLAVYRVRFDILVQSANKTSTLHTIQSLLVHKNASHCSKMSKKIIRRLYDIIK